MLQNVARFMGCDIWGWYAIV